jgi:N-acetylneuraminic acid mutarotase
MQKKSSHRPEEPASATGKGPRTVAFIMECIMQRKLVLLLLAILFLGVVTAVSQAQIDPTPQPEEEPLILKIPPKQMIDGIYASSPEPFSSNAQLIPFSFTAEAPSDSCSDATPLIINPANPADGSSADVIDATEAADDPVLSCMWGTPQRSQGFRTVWFQMVPPVTGRVTFSTFGSDYDTVLGVYTGSCGSLISVQCNDDFNGFSSQGPVTVTEGETYYIEVADWSGARFGTQLNFSALLEPVDSNWDLVASQPASPAISRHAVVAKGQDIYVIGGQSGEPGLPQISNKLLKFNTSSKQWNAELNPIPGAGYSNTTAALVGSRIYLPSGYDGNNLGYDGIHRVYDIGGNYWETGAPVPKVNGENFAWASAAVPPSQDKYYLTGGMTSTEPLTNTAKVSMETFEYLPNGNNWNKLNPMQAGRYAHTAGWINGRGICVAGGLGVGTDAETGNLTTIIHRSAECSQPDGNWHFIGDMNIPRYGAGSVVGPDGKWYIFGGMTAGENGFPRTVTQTEIYDPVLGTWSIMGPPFNLGSFGSLPARFWPRGAMVGNYLWVVGGSIFTGNGEEALPVINRLHIPRYSTQIPIAANDYNESLRPDDTMAQARQLSPGTQQSRNFDQQHDFVDFYYFDLNPGRRINIQLDVPSNNNFDLYLYGKNKLQWSSSTNSLNGQDESISIVRSTDRYYIAVTRVFPSGQPDTGAYYTLRLN